MDISEVIQKVFALQEETEENKAQCFDKVIQHLLLACEDKREREQKRARIALKNISRFMKEVIEEK